MRERVRAELRWLGAPLTVLCLAVMVLNDHVMKEAWPGFVTGKLSDFTGLVFAPALVAVMLAAVGVRNPAPLALVSVAVGFTIVKTTYAGAAFASDLLSVVVPSLVLRDPTDLIALSGLLVSAWTRRQAWRLPATPARGVSAGLFVLPFAVVATAATSCQGHPSHHYVSVVTGDFSGPPQGPESRLVVDGSFSPVLDAPGTAEFERLTAKDQERLSGFGRSDHMTCIGAECWLVEESALPVVEHTLDGGRTWTTLYAMSADELQSLEEDEACGDGRRVVVTDVAALRGRDSTLVVVTLYEGGVLVGVGDSWSLVRDVVPRESPQRTRGPTTPLVPEDQPSPSGSPSGYPTTCPSPSYRTVTPDPRNGPPTVSSNCP